MFALDESVLCRVTSDLGRRAGVVGVGFARRVLVVCPGDESTSGLSTQHIVAHEPAPIIFVTVAHPLLSPRLLGLCITRL